MPTLQFLLRARSEPTMRDGMHDKLRHGILRWWSQLITRRARWVLIASVAMAVLAILITAVGVQLGPWEFGPLRFQSDRNALIAEDLDWNRWFLDWQANFPGRYDLLVVVDADPTNEGLTPQKLDRARALVDELKMQLLEDESVVTAVWGFDAKRHSGRAIRLLPAGEFRQRLSEIERARPLLDSTTIQALIGRTISDLQQGQTQPLDTTQVVPSIQSFAHLIDAIGQRLDAPDGDTNYLAELFDDQPPTYLTSENNRLFFIRVTPFRKPRALNALAGAISSIRNVIDDVSKRHRGPNVGLTGLEVIEADETAAATRDTTIASLVAFGLITTLLVLAFQSWRTPLLVAISLLFGITWSFGFLTIAIGHLQVISVVFTVILLGLGIAYGIHLASRFELVRHQYPDNRHGFQMALRDSFETMGPGVITGAVTTAAAFATTLFTDFKGVAEMGLIASFGVLLCLLAMFTVFPTLLRLKKSKHRHVVPMQDRFVHFFEDRWVMPFVRWPKLTLLVVALITGLSLLAIGRMRFDYNLMRLQPLHVDSVTWQQQVAENSERSIWFGVSIAEDLDEARQRADAFRGLSTVGSVGGVAMLFPQDEDMKLKLLQDTRAALGDSLEGALLTHDESEQLETADLATQLNAMQIGMRLAENAPVPEQVQPALKHLNAAIDQTAATLSAMSPAQQQQKLARVQREYRDWRRHTARRIDDLLDTAPLHYDDLPPSLMKPFREIGDKGRVILEVYPKRLDSPESAGDGPLHPDFLPHFYREMSEVDPKVTGSIVQIYRSGKLIKDSYLWAGVGALVVVFLLVLLDFRRFDDAFLCLIPVGVGFAVTFGVMWLVGMSINPANIIVLPLMFGIGVDSGVHILHRYRQDPNTRPLGLSHGTGKGITVTSMTTVIGFGCMMLAKHRGIFSLGFVLALGILMTMVACWTVMPAWLELRESAKQKKAERISPFEKVPAQASGQ